MSGIKITNIGSREKEPLTLKDLSYGTVFLFNGEIYMKIQVDGKIGCVVNLKKGISHCLNLNITVRNVVELYSEIRPANPKKYFGIGRTNIPQSHMSEEKFGPKTAEEMEPVPPLKEI